MFTDVWLTTEQYQAILAALDAAEKTLNTWTPTHARQELRLKLAAAREALNERLD